MLLFVLLPRLNSTASSTLPPLLSNLVCESLHCGNTSHTLQKRKKLCCGGHSAAKIALNHSQLCDFISNQCEIVRLYVISSCAVEQGQARSLSTRCLTCLWLVVYFQRAAFFLQRPASVRDSVHLHIHQISKQLNPDS